MSRVQCGLLALLVACGDSKSSEPGPEGDASAEADAAISRDASGLDAALDASPNDTRDAGTTPDAAAVTTVRLPPANGGLDYQLGGAYAPPPGVSIVSRDRTAMPARGLYNICYVNGFQAQEGEAAMWLAQHPDLILRDDKAQPVIDEDWNEMLLDIGSADKRARLEAVVGGWIDGCAKAGFDAVEVDNLDSYTRSGSRLKEDDAVQFLALLSKRAHASGLAMGQKNASELAERRRELGSDFAVSEECSRYDECNAYITAYGAAVLMIEYRRADFTKGCKDHPDFSIVLRDLNLVEPSDQAYVFEDC